jgi:hypothetical protein
MWGRKQPEPKPEVSRCSFCHKSKDAVAKLIASPGDVERVYICDECVGVCQSILEDDREARESPPEPVVGAYASESDALLAQAALKAAGIPARVSTGAFKVLVRDGDLEDARELLNPE